jgi:hypothetical protein
MTTFAHSSYATNLTEVQRFDALAALALDRRADGRAGTP